MRQVNRAELTECHDCRRGVSFTAAACPHCGSTQPQGPYVRSRREQRLFDIERRNDRRLFTTALGCCAGGVAYGVIMAPGPWWAAVDGVGYGFVGLVIGVPAAVILNLTHRWLG